MEWNLRKCLIFKNDIFNLTFCKIIFVFCDFSFYLLASPPLYISSFLVVFLLLFF